MKSVMIKENTLESMRSFKTDSIKQDISLYAKKKKSKLYKISYHLDYIKCHTR